MYFKIEFVHNKTLYTFTRIIYIFLNNKRLPEGGEGIVLFKVHKYLSKEMIYDKQEDGKGHKRADQQ